MESSQCKLESEGNEVVKSFKEDNHLHHHNGGNNNNTKDKQILDKYSRLVTRLDQPESVTFQPIGFIRSCFKEKFGSPRQGWLVPDSRGYIQLTLPTSGWRAIDGLQEFSHLWIIFVFSLNDNKKVCWQVAPPRKPDKRKVGIFATRSPHRPNNIGQTLAKIEQIDVKKGRILLSCVDLVCGTPVIDIKPYISTHDTPLQTAFMPSWIIQNKKDHTNPLETNQIKVIFSETAERSLVHFTEERKILEYYNSITPLKRAICQVIASDPRDKYRKQKTTADNTNDGDGAEVENKQQQQQQQIQGETKSKVMAKDNFKNLYKFRIDVLNIVYEYVDTSSVVVCKVEDWRHEYILNKRFRWPDNVL